MYNVKEICDRYKIKIRYQSVVSRMCIYIYMYLLFFYCTYV